MITSYSKMVYAVLKTIAEEAHLKTIADIVCSMLSCMICTDQDKQLLCLQTEVNTYNYPQFSEHVPGL